MDLKQLCLLESQVQLGSGDGGTDPRLFLLGLHRDANPGGVHLLQVGSEQVGGPPPEAPLIQHSHWVG